MEERGGGVILENISWKGQSKTTKPVISIILNPIKIQATHLPITHHKLYGLIYCYGNCYVIHDIF